MQVNKSIGNNEQRGTWGHPKVAIRFAQWCSDNFAVQVDIWIDQLLTSGKVVINSAKVSQTPQKFSEALYLAAKLQEEKEHLEAEKELLLKENHQLSEAVDELFNYSSIIRIAKFNNVSEINFSWRRLKVISEKMGIEIKRVPCPRFEWKNLYSHDVWRIAYSGVKLPETITLTIH